jgi:hypothetical protein
MGFPKRRPKHRRTAPGERLATVIITLEATRWFCTRETRATVVIAGEAVYGIPARLALVNIVITRKAANAILTAGLYAEQILEVVVSGSDI